MYNGFFFNFVSYPDKKKSVFEITYAAIIRINDDVTDQKEIKKIILSDVPNEIYPRLEKALLNATWPSELPEANKNISIPPNFLIILS